MYSHRLARIWKVVEGQLQCVYGILCRCDHEVLSKERHQQDCAGKAFNGWTDSDIYCWKYPELVEKLILVAPAGFETFNKGQRQWFREMLCQWTECSWQLLSRLESITLTIFNMPWRCSVYLVDDRIAIRSAKDFPRLLLSRHTRCQNNGWIFRYLMIWSYSISLCWRCLAKMTTSFPIDISMVVKTEKYAKLDPNKE